MSQDTHGNPLPCSCENGHMYSESEAEQIHHVCLKDGTPITCVPTPGGEAPPSGEEPPER
jgi:hypothetical protein